MGRGGYVVPALEPGVLAEGAVAASEAHFGRLVHELLDDALGGLVGHVGGVGDGVLDDLLVDLEGVFSLLAEGQASADELVEADT